MSELSMSRATERAIGNIRRVMALAERLIAYDLVIDHLECDRGFGGYWTIQVERGREADHFSQAVSAGQRDMPGHEVLYLFFDAREREVLIRSAPTRPLSNPWPWSPESRHPVEGFEAALRFAEEYIVRWVGVSE